MKKFLQSFTPEQLSTVFSEENFISMARNIKDVIRKTQDRTEQINGSVREIKKVLKKLNFEGSEFDS